MKKALFLFTLIIIVCVTACNKQSDSIYAEQLEESKGYVLPIEDLDQLEEEIEENIFEFEAVLSDQYTVDQLEIEGVKSPNGILCREDDILISDGANDTLVVIDFDGNIIRKLGKTGNGPLEFVQPGDIVNYKDRIYILDEKNHRVQILDEELNYIDEVETRVSDPNDPQFIFQNMAVNETGIFVNGFSYFNSRIYLYMQKEKAPVMIGKNFFGPLYEYQEEIYAINTGNKAYDRKEDSMHYVSGGDNFIFRVDTEKKDLELKHELMAATDATGFIMDQKHIVAVSASQGSVFSFSEDGNYEYTIAYIEDLQKEKSLDISVDPNGNYYVTASENGKVFRVSMKK